MLSIQDLGISLLFLLIVATQLTVAEFSSCIPEEYRGVRREIWRGLNGGWYLTHLTELDKRYPNSPTAVEIIPTFTPPRNDDNFYGQRLQAYFVPPVSGNYSFFATCDSECAFFLSTDERSENKKELIRIDQDHRTGYDEWDRYPIQKSCYQQLEGGKLYYIEALHCNYINNDHVRIHIKFPGSNTTRSLDKEYLFLYSPDSSDQTTCILLRQCGVTCGGGLETRITTREEFLSGACVQHEGSYKEPPALYVEAVNITTSTALLIWRTLNRTESSVLDFTGYRVSLKSERDDSRVRMVNTSTNSLFFEGLSVFTNYCVIVEPLTALESTWEEDCYSFFTDEDTPDLPPQDIIVEITKQSAIIVRWKPIPKPQQNGIILGYKLTFKTKSAIGQLEKPVERETVQWPRFETVVDGNEYFMILRDVKYYTWYCIKMLGFTSKGDGEESSCVFILTEEGVPSRPPTNITTVPLNSTSFSVALQPVPAAHVHGIALGYKISLENIDDAKQLSTETLNINQTQIVLREPSNAPRFCVRILAYTSKGDGVKSDCIEGWTWSEETLFPSMKAANHGRPTDITITWSKPRDEVLRQLAHYHVTYETVSAAGHPVVNSTQSTLNVSAELQQVTFKDLPTYTSYKITVSPVMKDVKLETKKVVLAKTCRCPHLMYAHWNPSPPYVIQQRSASEPRGLIPELLAHMLQESCGTCFNYKTWNISYSINTTKSITNPDTRAYGQVDFRFPVRSAVGKTTYRGFHSYVPLITVPGVALMTRKTTPSGYARDVGHSVLACWPIFAVSIVLAVLTGVIIWFAERESNDRQFFTYQFHKGVVEGVWWSFITMTTVGYGDRYPKTIVGRCIAILWFLTGIVLSSLLVSSITSSMSVRILDRQLNVARGKKVGSLAQFPEYDLLIRFISKAGESSTFPTLEGLVTALKYADVDAILVDLYTANYRSDLFNATWIVVSQIISYDFTSGVVISGNASKLEQHFRDYVGNRSTVVTEVLQKTNEANNKQDTIKRDIQTKKIPLLDPSTHIYRVTIFVLLALLCVVVFIGMVYHSWYKGKKKRRYEIEAIRRRQRREYMKAKLELQQMVEEFYQRFALTYQQMRVKHRKQLERFKMTQMSNGKIPLKYPYGTWV